MNKKASFLLVVEDFTFFLGNIHKPAEIFYNYSETKDVSSLFFYAYRVFREKREDISEGVRQIKL
ncbi:hypothetical protein ACH33_14740 [Aneurinibacillus sp. XH2]|nr:hypothetical protein ACH33_14740 [Aneurinibacillus sp. XH2]